MTAAISSMRRRGLKCTLKRTLKRTAAIALACGLSFASVTTSAQARSLTMALASEPQSLDPLFSRTQNNMQTAENMFERLIEQDDNLQVRPGLAVSWRAVDPLTWEFHLRPNVRFSDNSPMTADDVAYSLRRARSVPNSPAPYSGAVANIERIEVVDPLTLRIVTKTPSPAFVEQIGLV
jgi:ABC-type dipeptide transport system, periplasmic component